MLRLRLTLMVLCLLLLASVSATAASAHRSMQSRDAIEEKVSKYARSFVGVPYRYGGSSPRSGFDCSGFVAFVYRHFGIRLPHYTYAQYGRGRRVSVRSLRPGDLVFFYGLGHVGLYVGHQRFIHAPHTGARVRVERFHYAGFAGARRLI